jgi:uncharacterized protein (UPF0332 family)
MITVRADNEEDSDLFFSAETNYKQFLAIASYFRHFDSLSLISELDYFNNTLRKSPTCQIIEIRKWLMNSWNTERILRANTDWLETDNNYFILQWSYPQAYYAAFASTLAFFKTVGHQTESHSGVIKKFGELVAENKYPKDISFCCHGTKTNISYLNINCTGSPASYELNIFDINSVQNKICQFLKTTRRLQLDEKRNDKNVKGRFKTKKGHDKLVLKEKEWKQISDMVSFTSLLNLLYRKRIKANYQNVDTFNYEGLKTKEINKCLVNIINRINLIHETMIYKAIGFNDFTKIYQAFTKGKEVKYLDERFSNINNFLG